MPDTLLSVVAKSLFLPAVVGFASGWIAHTLTNRREREKLIVAELTKFIDELSDQADEIFSQVQAYLRSSDHSKAVELRDQLNSAFRNTHSQLEEAKAFQKARIYEKLNQAYVDWTDQQTGDRFGTDQGLNLPYHAPELALRRQAHGQWKLRLRTIRLEAIEAATTTEFERILGPVTASEAFRKL